MIRWSRMAVVPLVTVALFQAPRPAFAIWNQTSFLIGGYNVGNPPGVDRLIHLNDAGIDFAVTSDVVGADGWVGDSASQSNAAGLFEFARVHRPGFNMKAILYLTQGPSAVFKNLDPAANRQAILSSLSPAGNLNNPSVMGWLVWDEPPLYLCVNSLNPSHCPPPTARCPGNHAPTVRASQIFPLIGEMTRLLRDSLDSPYTYNKLALTNQWNINASGVRWNPFGACYTPCDTVNPAIGYGCLLDSYLDLFAGDDVGAPVLSFDDYPFIAEDLSNAPRYFQGLAVVRDRAAKHSRSNHRMPFWSVIQASRHGIQKTPTMNQIRWQAYVSLAYGAKGIVYWTLAPWAGDGGWSNTFLEANGTIGSARYDDLKNLNTEIHVLGPHLMALDPIAAYHVAAHDFVMPSGEGLLSDPSRAYNIVESITGTGSDQAMFGYFKHHVSGEDYLLVVNKDDLDARSFTLNLTNVADSVVRYHPTTGNPVVVGLGTTSFVTGTIPAGGGRLFRIEFTSSP